jgi:hypothetical protein
MSSFTVNEVPEFAAISELHDQLCQLLEAMQLAAPQYFGSHATEETVTKDFWMAIKFIQGCLGATFEPLIDASDPGELMRATSWSMLTCMKTQLETLAEVIEFKIE